MTPQRPAEILFFVKAPLPGRVKSRLAASLGEEDALRLYRAFVEDMLETIDGSGLPARVFVHPPDAISAVPAWLGRHRRYHPQDGADLGARMANGFRGIFAQGCSRAVLIGSDLPDLPSCLLHEALDALDRNDAVIGPARDGGYYLIGFRRETFLPAVFHGIRWSGDDVFVRTAEHLRNNGISTHILPRWRDVDTVDDLRDLARRTEGTAFAGSRTMRAVKGIRPERMRAEDSHA
jgi:hypothetical protein